MPDIDGSQQRPSEFARVALANRAAGKIGDHLGYISDGNGDHRGFAGK